MLTSALLAAFGAAAASPLLGACSPRAGGEPPGDTSTGGGGGAGPECKSSPISVDPMRSLIVTDADVLSRFDLEKVMDAIVQRGGAGQSALDLYQQWWDTENDKRHAVVADGPHCDDEEAGGSAALNGFPVDCPRQEGVLAATNPFDGGQDSYTALALVNRFDLAPPDGATCGEYRIVYAKRPLNGEENFINFEGVLPNPDPAAGLRGCLPVAQLWADLSAMEDVEARGHELESFYFEGLSGFGPVIRPESYGLAADGTPTGRGQLRTNQFLATRDYFGMGPLNQSWQLRELKLSQRCAGGSCALVVRPVPVQNSPYRGLFDGSSTDARAASFQAAFLGQVPALAKDDVSLIAMETDLTFDAAQNTSQPPNEDSLQITGAGFRSSIQRKLQEIGRTDLTVDDIGARALTQTCAGCHSLIAGSTPGQDQSLGGGAVWPNSLGFTHIREDRTLSDALVKVFLPRRKAVLESFLHDAACGS